MATDLATLIAAVQDLLGRRTLSQQEFGDWLAGSAIGGPNANGTFPLTDSTGFVRMLPSPAKMQALAARDRGGVVYPDDFDAAAGTGSSHDDATCLQAMFNAQYLPPYPRPALRPRARYYCSATLLVDPSRNTLDGNSAQIGWDLKTFTNPDTMPELVSDPSFDTGAPWIKSANDSVGDRATYDGQLRLVQEPGVNRYFERGQQILCDANALLTISVTIASITPNTVGINTFHDVLFTLRRPGSTPAASIGSGGLVGSVSYSIGDNDTNYSPNTTYTWQVSSSVANPYLRIQSNAGFVFDSITIKAVPNNTCLLVRVPRSTEGGALRGHNQRAWRDCKLSGKAGSGPYVDAVLFDTPTYSGGGDVGQHSRVNWYNFDISDNVGRGLIFQNRTYLSNFFGFRIVTSEASIDTIRGADAGENISFFGGNLGGGKIAVRNRAGYMLRFHGTSMDFCQQFIVGHSVILTNCWLENGATGGSGTFTATIEPGSNRITNFEFGDWTTIGATISGTGIPDGTTVIGYSSAGTRTLTLSQSNTNTASVREAVRWRLETIDRPLIDCGSGKITLHDTLIQQDGTTATRLRAPFNVAAGGFLEIEANHAFNLTARDAALCTGAGRFSFRIKSSGPNRAVEPINKRDDNHNTIGAAGRFEGARIEAPVWLGASAANPPQQALDRYTISQDSFGSFTADATIGSAVLYNVAPAPSAAVLGRVLRDPAFVDGTIITDYQVASATGFQVTTTNGTNVLTGVTPAPTAGTVRSKYVAGPGIQPGSRVLTYNNSAGTITLDKPCTATSSGSVAVTMPNVVVASGVYRAPSATGLTFGYRQPSTDRGIMRLTSAYPAFDGAQCLEVYKDLPTSAPLQVYLATPLEPNRGYGGELRWAVPPRPGATGTGSVFFSIFLAQIDDAFGASPRLATSRQQLTDLPKTVIPIATGTDGWVDRSPFDTETGMWRRLVANLNVPGLGEHDGYTPEWATHLVWVASLIGMPRGSSVLFDGLIGNNQ